MPQAEAVRDLMAESHGPIIIDVGTDQPQNEEVANVLAILFVASKDRKAVHATSSNVLPAAFRRFAKLCRSLVPMYPQCNAIEHADRWVRPPPIRHLRDTEACNTQ